MPLWFGHGKRIENIEVAVKELGDNVNKGFEQVIKKIDEIDDGLEEETIGENKIEQNTTKYNRLEHSRSVRQLQPYSYAQVSNRQASWKQRIL